jgi:PPOX class probable F420-dependent enzyme
MDNVAARAAFARARVARLATIRADGAPHVVPVVFALNGDLVYTAVDQKPKRTSQLQRLDNLWHEPRCALLVDEYTDDWSQLWWVRADGRADIVERPRADHPGLALLAARYATYRADAPKGALLVISVKRWTGWTAGTGGRR